MNRSANLNLPLLAAGQAQKHITMNEALTDLDALVQISVATAPSDTPPTDPPDGVRHLVAADPIGAWIGHAGDLAVFLDGGWRFYAPQPGWLALVEETGTLMSFHDEDWRLLVMPGAQQDLSRLGVGGEADAGNPVLFQVNTVLLTARTVADGGDDSLRLKVNKTGVADSGSLLMQSGFSGRAEAGLLGDDDFSIKVSADGVTWTTGLVIGRANGVARLPANPRFSAYISYDPYVASGTWTKIPFNSEAFDPQSAFDTANNRFVAPVAGTYRFHLAIGVASDGSLPSGVYAAFYLNGVEAVRTRRYGPATPGNAATVSTTAMLSLAAGDQVEAWTNFAGGDSYVENQWSSFSGQYIA